MNGEHKASQHQQNKTEKRFVQKRTISPSQNTYIRQLLQALIIQNKFIKNTYEKNTLQPLVDQDAINIRLRTR